jgi:hypothetical protein
MHVLFLAPEHPAPHRDYVEALKRAGARVSGLGHQRPAAVEPAIHHLLDHYEQVGSLFDEAAVLAAALQVARRREIDRVEAVDEMLTLPAARLRAALAVPGLSVESAILCRDKTAMKEVLRRGGVPCAASAAVASLAEARQFAEQVGFPLILKPRAGLASQNTFRVETVHELEQASAALRLQEGSSAAIEEFVEGHEGFYDTLAVDGEVRHEFIAHYYPNVLVAMSDRTVAPQIAATNRVHADSYEELRRLGRVVIELLGINTSATHMEWFFGPRGLKFSEIGARPPGERLWDLHCAGNELDLYHEWALAVTGQRSQARASRRFATGSIQVRPDRDGHISGYQGLDAVWQRSGPYLTRSSIPQPGSETRPMRLGYLENCWFRLRHPDYDELRALMDFIGRTVRVHAVAG